VARSRVDFAFAIPSGTSASQRILLPGVADNEFVRLKSLTIVTGNPQGATGVAVGTALPHQALFLQDTIGTTIRGIEHNNHVGVIALHTHVALYGGAVNTVEVQMEEFKRVVFLAGMLPVRAKYLRYWTTSATLSGGQVLVSITFEKAALTPVEAAILQKMRGSA